MQITLNQVKEFDPCENSWKKALAAAKGIGGDTPINMSDVLKGVGINDTFWVISEMNLTPNEERDFRLLACRYAEPSLPIFEKAHPGDMRPRECIEVAKRHAVGEATEDERVAARAAARSAALSAEDSAARSAVWSAEDSAARAAAWSAAWSAARAAVRSAARSGAWAAEGAAEGVAEGQGALPAEKKSQEEMLMALLLRMEKKS